MAFILILSNNNIFFHCFFFQVSLLNFFSFKFRIGCILTSSNLLFTRRCCVLTHFCLVFDFKTNIGIIFFFSFSSFGSNLALHVFSLGFFSSFFGGLWSSLVSYRKNVRRTNTFCRSLCFTMANLGNGKQKNGRIQKNRSYKNWEQNVQAEDWLLLLLFFPFLFLPPFAFISTSFNKFACCFIILFSYCIFSVFMTESRKRFFYEVSAHIDLLYYQNNNLVVLFFGVLCFRAQK